MTDEPFGTESEPGCSDPERPGDAAPSRWRKKPVVIDAIRWTGSNPAALRAFAGSHFGTVDPEDRGENPEQTAQVFDVLHSTWVSVFEGQWVIRGIAGEFYPIADDVFRATYEAAS
jgi:hypothetical protein